MNPNQPDPMSEEEIGKIADQLTDEVYTHTYVLIRPEQRDRLCATALRAISLEKAIDNLVRDLDEQTSILEARHADTNLSGPTRIGASHRARDLREWRDSVAALAKPRAVGGEEDENG